MKFQKHEFCEYRPLVPGWLIKRLERNLQRSLDRTATYVHLRGVALENNLRITHDHTLCEERWTKNNRPYYNVWPRIVAMFLKLDISRIQLADVKLPVSPLLIAFSKHDTTVEKNGHRLRTIIAHTHHNMKREPVTQLFCDFGEYDDGDERLAKAWAASIEHRGTVLTMLEESRCNESSLSRIEHECVVEAMNVICTLCLLEDDPTIIEPDVLDKHRHQWLESRDGKYVQAAIKRGKRGWNVGRNLTVNPHTRNPHECLFWTGKDRKKPVIKIRRGSVIHRKVVEKVPTGTAST
jgi:hypothetical protein